MSISSVSLNINIEASEYICRVYMFQPDASTVTVGDYFINLTPCKLFIIAFNFDFLLLICDTLIQLAGHQLLYKTCC